jgi:hypothetical protein
VVISTFCVNLVDFNGKIVFLHLILRYLFPLFSFRFCLRAYGVRRSVLPFLPEASVASSCGSSISLIDSAVGSLP